MLLDYTLYLWHVLTHRGSILFHHSHLRLSERPDGLLSRLIVAPRLHGIHHARDPRLRESNWSNGLALWDVLHRTRITGVPQPEIGLE